jgi:SHS2 domain-containing protein
MALLGIRQEKSQIERVAMTSNPSTICTVEELGHTSEIGLSLRASTAPGLFRCAAQEMFRLIHPSELELTEQSRSRHFSVTADDHESLLVDWLSELLFLYETTGLIFHGYDIKRWDPTLIEATVTGDEPDQRPAMHIKAVTYHQLEVTRTADDWRARLFFDI